MKHFFSEEAFHLLKTSLKNMENTSNTFNLNNIEVENGLFEFAGNNQRAFSVEYLRYLSRYANSTLNFNEPVKIDIEASDDLFWHLYKEFVFSETEEIKKESSIETVKTKLYPSIKSRVNLDYHIDTGAIPGLIIPVELDFIGKNDKPVVGKITDFSSPNPYLDATLAKFILLVNTLEANRQPGISFIIADEPDKVNVNRHKTWNEIRTLKQVSLVPFSETQLITEYMEEHDVRPYFETAEV